MKKKEDKKALLRGFQAKETQAKFKFKYLCNNTYYNPEK